MRDLSRLLRPQSLAVVGGGAWCGQVIEQARRFGFAGPIRSVHPRAAQVAGVASVASVRQLDIVPDAVFVGVNRHTSRGVLAELADIGAGGAVCFASGFAEAQAEDAGARALQEDLVAAAGEMPILGPNCYGFINAMDRALLWPDQHGCVPVERGVAILTQSSNIAINLSMQRRAVPIGFVGTCGNMAQISQAGIALALLDDPRITVIGMHIEGFGDLRQWEALATKAREREVPLVAIKVGASDQARAATVTHTASLAGSDAGAQAFLDRLGIARLRDLPTFLEVLKLLHVTGPLSSDAMASISCSGGEASLIADLAVGRALRFPALPAGRKVALAAALGPMVALSNPLDYHTYIWRDTAAMTRAWGAMTGPDIGLTLSIVDYPHTDPTDWACATDAALAVRAETGAAFGVVATLPELMPQDTAARLMEGGVVPFFGLNEALSAAEAAARAPAPPDADPVLLAAPCPPAPDTGSIPMTEAEAKAALAAQGLPVPRGCLVRGDTGVQAIAALRPPLAAKGQGLAHKTDSGAVRLNLDAKAAIDAARDIGTAEVLVEEMVPDAVVELLIGVTRDPAHGFVLTLGAGGALTELLRDTGSLLVPASRASIGQALASLRIAPQLAGYRGRPGASLAAILDAVDAVQAYVVANAATLCELEINPLICTPMRAVAADALIRHMPEPEGTVSCPPNPR
ncbi:MAG: acetate--CoA ligase family protein [Rhodobacteraceae bacterium]|nr:acetate--CoA ligase family protein [Paracoccaceae bacterium]